MSQDKIHATELIVETIKAEKVEAKATNIDTGGDKITGKMADAENVLLGKESSQTVTTTTTTQESPNFTPSIVVAPVVPVLPLTQIPGSSDTVILYLVAQNATMAELKSGQIALDAKLDNQIAVVELRFKGIDTKVQEIKTDTQILAIEISIKAIEAEMQSRGDLIEMRLRTLEKE